MCRMKKRMVSLLMASLVASLTACLGPAPAPPSGSDNDDGIAYRELGNRTTLYAMRTGWVLVKKNHRELTVPDPFAIPAIFGGQWSTWMPIIVYLIKHPEGYVLVDTGPAAEINAPGYYDCDPNNQVFYYANLKFEIPQDETLKARLTQLNISVSEIKKVLITHFHADHIGGVLELPLATFYTGPGNWPEHVGAFTCQLPPQFQPIAANYLSEPIEGFNRSFPLTQDKRLRVVPLPGHTPGHAGLWIQGDEYAWLLAGDATFDIPQTQRLGVTGVSQDLAQARATQALLKKQRSSLNILPAHDATVFERLQPK
jgi:N-acyl homoserine lactone hydrolase